MNTICLPVEKAATCLYRATGDPFSCLRCELPYCIDDEPPVAAPQKTDEPSTSADPRRCRKCGEWFLARPRSRKRYCSSLCRVRYHSKREHRRQSASYVAPSPRAKENCQHCGRLFTPLGKHHKCCSARCYNKDYKLAHNLIKDPNFTPTLKECPQCGRPFTSHIPKNGGKPTTYCSERCRIRWHNKNR